jgi:hypothetical protein
MKSFSMLEMARAMYIRQTFRAHGQLFVYALANSLLIA